MEMCKLESKTVINCLKIWMLDRHGQRYSVVVQFKSNYQVCKKVLKNKDPRETSIFFQQTGTFNKSGKNVFVGIFSSYIFWYEISICVSETYQIALYISMKNKSGEICVQCG